MSENINKKNKRKMTLGCFFLDNGKFRVFRLTKVPESILKTRHMEIRIKTQEGMVDATITIENGIMVVQPKEEKFEPKDGDVLVYMNEGLPTIYIYRAGTSLDTSYYAAYSNRFSELYLSNMEDHLNGGHEGIRLATEKEKQQLFKKLAEEGYSWDSEKKAFVKIKWEPKRDDWCYRPILDKGRMVSHQTRWLNGIVDNSYYDKGWYFKTEAECQAFCDRLNEAINQVKP